MALRMIELILPRDHAERLKESFDATDFEVLGLWTEDLDDDKKKKSRRRSRGRGRKRGKDEGGDKDAPVRARAHDDD